MLVEMMSRMLALTQMHNAQYAMMNNNMRMYSLINRLPAFSGSPQTMQSLANLDNQFAMNKEVNEVNYALAKAQYDASKNSMQNNKLSYIA